VLVGGDGVEQLVHPGHAQGGHVEHLGLTPLEQGRAVGRGEQVHLGRERTDLRGGAAVDAQALLHDPLADQLLGQAPHCGLDLTAALGELGGHRLDDERRGGVQGLVALGLGHDGVGLGDGVGADSLDPLEDVVLVVGEGGVRDDLHRAALGHPLLHQMALEDDRLADPRLGGLEAIGQDLLGDLGGALLVVLEGPLRAAGLDHHDGDLGVGRIGQSPARHHQLEGGLVTLLEGGMGDPLAVGRVGHPDRPDGTLEGDARDHQGRRGAVDGQDVVGVDLVGTEDRAHDVDLVAEALGEGRAQRAVDEPVGEDGLVRGLALPAEERAGDLAGGVGPLLDVHGQREEVGSLPDGPGCCGRGQQDGVADPGHDGPVGQLGQLAGFECECAIGAADGPRHGYGV